MKLTPPGTHTHTHTYVQTDSDKHTRTYTPKCKCKLHLFALCHLSLGWNRNDRVVEGELVGYGRTGADYNSQLANVTTCYKIHQLMKYKSHTTLEESAEIKRWRVPVHLEYSTDVISFAGPNGFAGLKPFESNFQS